MRVSRVLLIATVLLAGCAHKAAPPPPAPPKAPSEQKIELLSKAGEAKWYAKTPDHRLLWHVYWESAQVLTVEAMPKVGEMSGVHGAIGSGDSEKTFKADKAQADEAANVLTLTGGVSVQYAKNEAHMKCDKLVYDGNLKRFDAKGNVSLVSKSTEVKGVPELMSDSDFNEVATPDMFQHKQIKKLSKAVGASLLAASAMASANSRQSGTIKYGDTTVTGISSWRLTRTGTGDHLTAVHAKGEVIHLISQSHGLNATCGQVEGTVKNGIIQAATLSGGVYVSIKRPSSNAGSGQIQTATASGAEAVYAEANNTLHVTGGVDLTDGDPGANRSMKASGDSADIVLSPQKSNQQAFASASLDSNVNIDWNAVRTESGKTVPYTLHATCHHAAFDNVNRTITLKGHVHMMSDDPAEPEITGETEVIHLNPDGSIESAEGTGAPGIQSIDLNQGK